VDQATCTIQDNDGMNQPPIAVDDAQSGDTGKPIGVAVLANDYDPDGSLDYSTLAIVLHPAHGMLSINAVTGVVTYVSNPGFVGEDVFRYEVDDNQGQTSNEAEVVVTVNPSKTSTRPLR
jgi:hypothetical protein